MRELDINWKLQQENALLRKELALLKKENQKYQVIEIASGIPPAGRFFTDIQLDFIKTNNLDYGRIYSLAVKYGSVKDSLIEVWEESYGT